MGHVGRQLLILTALLFTGRVYLHLRRNPARVFLRASARACSRNTATRMACNECGGYREGLVLSPPAGFYADTSPPMFVFCFSAGGFSLLQTCTRMASKSMRLPPERCLCEARSEKTVESLLGGEIRSRPGSNVVGALIPHVPPCTAAYRSLRP